ncbi:ATP-binding protein [Maricaulis sp.]|uniref:ATP-binding protein n=1 Tax=unclassified Maricaulis TaxID=2632371 RepID=UPI001B1CCBA6|nr:ATP-binding protein [Maricaulis sp.]MBO6797267.1 PAS domain S-box protein [Maricaulis sp.]
MADTSDDQASQADREQPPVLQDDDLLEPDSWIGQILPGILAVGFIIIVALAVMAGERALMSSARTTNQATLETVLANTFQRYEDWAAQQESHVRIWSQDVDVQGAVRELNFVPAANVLRASPLQVELSVMLTPWLNEYGYTGFSVVSPDGVVLAGSASEELGAASMAITHVDMARLIANGVTLSAPYISDDLGEADEHGLLERPLMHAVSLIQDGEDLMGYLVFDLDPRRQYTTTFQVGRTGASGDTFVVDNQGRLLSSSRYEDIMIAEGLLVESHPSLLHLEVRDPGLDLTVVGRPQRPYDEWPLTYAAADVVAGNSGTNLRGYRDLRGILVMGAWQWFPDRNFGLVTEVEVSEALAGANQARAVLRVFAVAMALSFILLAVLFSAHRNISRQRAQATHEAKQRFSQILMTAAEGIYGIDGEGHVTFINPRACEMLGYTEEELIGKVMHTMVHHSHRDGSLYPKEECPVHTYGVPIEETDKEVFWTKNGQPIPIEFATSVIDPDDPSLGAVITFRDIAKRKRDEQALRRYAQELKRSNAELQEFAYAASHDLQEPLRKIQAFGERLNNKYAPALDDTGRHYLERMVDAAGRMRRLIDDLLSYSRVNSKTTSYLPVELAGVVADVLSDLEPRIAAEDAKIRVGELPAIEADPGQMHQLFLNLLANALKFCRPGVTPNITIESNVEVGEAGAVARISITDNGIGFEPRHAERIFGMFERLHGREEFDGTGVGLATCRKIAERHSGELSAWGEPEAGAVFTLILPIRQGTVI